MKRYSVKTKITLWLTGLTVVLCLLLVGFLLSISRSVVAQTARERLTQVMREQVAMVRCQDGRPVLAEGFQFYSHGVSVLIYSKTESLLAGQLPVAFTVTEAFENGNIHRVTVGDVEYVVLDLWVAEGWQQGLWVRGLLEIPESSQTTRMLLLMAAVALPLFILLAALGGYRIIRGALRPLDRINETADSIVDARDLHRRIGGVGSGDEFSRLAENFDRLLERMERAFEAEKQFTADASHELRTPLTVIRSASEYALQFEETPEERQETMEMIHRQAGKMQALIEQLLRMTRLEQGVEGLDMGAVDLTALLEEVALGYEEARLTLRLQQAVTVQGNGPLLTRLTGNLLDNAMKYAPEDTTIELSLERRQEEVLLTVRDAGPGIPPEAQEKIWQRFYQVDPARSEARSGAGLGLAMVQQIAELHGGYMTLESAPGVGSSFTLHLPETGEK